MPIPTPASGEKKTAFINRCMSDDKMGSEFPEGDQRLAVCSTSWDKAHPEANRVLLTGNMASIVREEELEGVKHWVLPAIMAVEGVMNGLLYPGEELSKFPEAWNGRPVPVSHPEENGEPVTCNRPDIITAQTVGKLFNTTYVGGKLKSEIWIDQAKAARVSPQLVNAILSNQHIEVSTGLFLEKEMVSGTFSGKPYHSVARNYRPDHLALLLGEKGACSWEDGAGAPRINAQEKVMNDVELLTNVVKALNLPQDILRINLDLSHEQIRQTLRDALANDQTYVYIVDVYDKYLVYEEESKPLQESGPYKSKYYKQSYMVDANGTVTLGNDRMEVTKVITYQEVSPTNNQVEPKPKEENMRPIVKELISNAALGLTEADAPELEKLSDEILAKMMPKQPEPTRAATPATNIQAEPTKVLKDPATQPPQAPRVQTLAEYLEAAPAEIRGVLQAGMLAVNKQRTDLIGKIKANKRNQFTDEFLGQASIDVLEGLAALAVVPDFGTRPVGPIANAGEDNEVLELPQMTVAGK